MHYSTSRHRGGVPGGREGGRDHDPRKRRLKGPPATVSDAKRERRSHHPTSLVIGVSFPSACPAPPRPAPSVFSAIHARSSTHPHSHAASPPGSTHQGKKTTNRGNAERDGRRTVEPEAEDYEPGQGHTRVRPSALGLVVLATGNKLIRFVGVMGSLKVQRDKLKQYQKRVRPLPPRRLSGCSCSES